MPDSKNLHVRPAPAVGDNVVANDQPARARTQTRRARVWKLRQLLLSPFECIKEALRRGEAIFGQVVGDFVDFHPRAAGTKDGDRHFWSARLASAFAIISLTWRSDSSSGTISPR